jgi:hypothetical protein
MRTRTISTLAAAVTAAGLLASVPTAQAVPVGPDPTSTSSTGTTSTAALSTLRQQTVDRANTLLKADLRYRDENGTTRLSTQPSANRNVLAWGGSNTNRNELNDFSTGYASGLDWCGHFVARTWTGQNTPDPAAFPRIPTYYMRSQAWRTDAPTAYVRFSEARLPAPGDVLVWQNGTGAAGVDNGSATGHVGVVTAVNATTKVVTSVEGNVAGDEIRRYTYAWDANGPTKDGKHFMGHASRH